jgi:hypothetical protein
MRRHGRLVTQDTRALLGCTGNARRDNRDMNKRKDQPGIERLNPKDRIVHEQPLKQLWDEDGNDLDVHPVRNLGAEEIREILRSGRPVPFVTTEHRFEWGGSRLKWVRGDDRFDFWKNEVQPHLLEAIDDYRRYDDFPDDYCYRATEWRGSGEDLPYCIVLMALH